MSAKKPYFKKQYGEALLPIGEDYSNVKPVVDITGYETLQQKLKRFTAFELKVSSQYDGIIQDGNIYEVDEHQSVVDEPDFGLAEAGQAMAVVMSKKRKKVVKTEVKPVVEDNVNDDSVKK